MMIKVFPYSKNELSSFSGFVGSVSASGIGYVSVCSSPLSGWGSVSASGVGYVTVCSSSLSGWGFDTGSLVVSVYSTPLSGWGFETGSLVVVSSLAGVGGLKSYFLQTLERPFVFVHIKYLSSRQIIEQPSSKKNHKKESLNLRSFLFPSSQFSVPSIIPFPQSKIILIFF